MNEARNSKPPSPQSRDGQPQNSLMERLFQAVRGEPKDRNQLLDLLHGAHKRDLIDLDALVMIEGVLQVSEMQVRDIMIPRSQMVVVERDASLEQILPTVVGSAHSRFPTIGDNKDQVIGILLAKDLLPYFLQGQDTKLNLREIMRPAVFIPESKRLNVLLKEFRASRNHMAIVVDEYGGVAGLVTIEDVLEQIVGEIEDEHDFEEDIYILEHGDDRYMVKAITPIEDFNERFGTEFSDEEFDTIGGLVVNALGHLPKRDETVDLGSLHFRVTRASSRRIHLLQVTRLPEEQEEQPQAGSAGGA